MDLSSTLFRARAKGRASFLGGAPAQRSPKGRSDRGNGPRKAVAETEPAPRSAASGFRERLREFLIAERWLLVVPVVLPLSKAYEGYWRLRHVYYRELRNVARLVLLARGHTRFDHDARV